MLSMLIQNIVTLQHYSIRKKVLWFIIGIIGSILSLLLFAPISSKMTDRGYDILDLEFAWNSTNLNPILIAWDDILDDIILFMIIDMFFPIFYFLIISGWTLILSSDNKNLNYTVLISFLASLFDYIENLFTFDLVMRPDNYLSISPFVVSLFASIKFLFLVIAIFK
ncbi:MAG: hypothetical protein HeimC2_04570 [Candidatus Heimdallarchaeota archaeon LC_2]|nr:MAG: hypothetical protein HeimC2_04570 [Candidatus Heimdallarchaeota archaeon LC_2]